jgi:hypothetical protein
MSTLTDRDSRLASMSLADLEAERVTREDELDHFRDEYPGSQAIGILERHLGDVAAEIASRGLIGE